MAFLSYISQRASCFLFHTILLAFVFQAKMRMMTNRCSRTVRRCVMQIAFFLMQYGGNHRNKRLHMSDGSEIHNGVVKVADMREDIFPGLAEGLAMERWGTRIIVYPLVKTRSFPSVVPGKRIASMRRPIPRSGSLFLLLVFMFCCLTNVKASLFSRTAGPFWCNDKKLIC